MKNELKKEELMEVNGGNGEVEYRIPIVNEGALALRPSMNENNIHITAADRERLAARGTRPPYIQDQRLRDLQMEAMRQRMNRGQALQ